MKTHLTKLLCTLALLGAVANTPAYQPPDPMTLNYSGYFGAESRLDGAFIAEGTPFSITATFNPAAPLPDSSPGMGMFSASTLSFLISGNTYAASSPAGQTILLGDPEGYGHYEVGLFKSDLSSYTLAHCTATTTEFHALSPTATVFSDFFANGYSGGYYIQLVGVEGGLLINDLSGDSTASLTTASVPEPSQWAAISCFGILGLVYVAKRRLTKATR